jgi:hypothetical protein
MDANAPPRAPSGHIIALMSHVLVRPRSGEAPPVSGPSSTGTYTYHFDVCGEPVQSCQSLSCAVRDPDPGTICQDLGGTGCASPQVTAIPGDNAGVQITFSAAVNSLTVQLTCDKSLEDTPVPDQVPTPVTDQFATGAATIVWPTFVSCLEFQRPSGGLSNGWIIIIL